MILDKTEENEKCPSCQLKLEDECEEDKRCSAGHICHKFNQHLVIPLLLLPVILLLLGIFRLVARPDEDILLFKSTVVRRGLGGITAINARAEESIVTLKESDNLEEFEDRDLINGFKTSFVPLITNALPLNMLTIPHQMSRRRRQLKEIVWNLKDMENMSNSDVIEWAAVKPPIRNSSNGKTGYPGEKQIDHKRNTLLNDTHVEDLFQGDEQETYGAMSSDDQIEGKQWSRKSFWDEDVDQENIRIAQARIMLSLMNMSVDPCADFYEYACGGWSNAYPIPKNRAGSGTIEILKSSIDEVVRRLLEYDSNENLENDDINIIKNENDDEFSTGNVKETLSRSNSSYEEIQQLVNKNNTDLSLIISLNDNSESKEQEKIMKEVTPKEKNLQSNDEVQEENSSILLSRPSNGVQGGHKESMSVGGNAEMLENSSKIFKGTKIMTEKTNDAIKKAKKFYKSCINTDIIQKRAEIPLVQILDELGGWPKPRAGRPLQQWTALAAKLRLYNNNILITEWIGPDIHNSEEYVIQLDKAGLGLPTRDYFLSESNTETVKAYHQFVMRVAVLLGATSKEAEKIADQLVNFEIHLALITVPHEEKKNLTEFYSKMTVSELCEAIPGINWRQYLSIILNSTNPNFNLSSLDSTPVQVFDMQYFHDLAVLLNKYHPRIIQSYMLWRFASHRAGNLDQRFWDARSQLRKMLTGREEAPPRWESCVAHTTAAIGHAVGSLFVKQHFDEQSKSDTLLMTTEIQAAFRQSLLDPDGATASWMDEETRSLAVDKADAMALRVGYPDLILDPDSLDELYANLHVKPDLYFENTLAVLRYITQREHSLLGTEVDKTQWSAPLTEVNAFYSRKKNQIFLPAGILQPPFYHRHFPKSLNYGGIGVVIGHEMTHGFDNRGRLFDRHGNLQRWWHPTAIEAFQVRAECLVDQYAQYHVEEVSMQIDGTRTQSENIADNGGLKQAYKAYENWLKINKNDQMKENEEILPGINASARQLFFLNFAQVWCGALRPEAIKNKLKTSIHSLEKFRVIGTLSNSEEFSEAFSCPLGSPMNPHSKCSVW